MKKVLFVLLASITFLACEGPEGPVGPQGIPGVPGENGYGNQWFTKTIQVKASEWKLLGEAGELNSYFYVNKSIPELTDYIYSKGTVLAYIESEKGIKNGLPFVSHRGGEDSKGEFLWTQTYDYDFQSGKMSFYFTYSDFSTWFDPEDTTFHIVFMW